MSWDCYLSLRLTPYLWYFTRDGRPSLLNFKNLVLVFTYWWISTRFSYSSTEYWMEFTHRFASIIKLRELMGSVDSGDIQRKVTKYHNLPMNHSYKNVHRESSKQLRNILLQDVFHIFFFSIYKCWVDKNQHSFYLFTRNVMFCQMWHITYSHTHPREPYVNMCIAVWMPKM